ncbi:MAG TPA: hypothetical protein VFE67_08820 [Rudaea sp.]|jgi:hypothetical protein|nr:hypothetical protein [Rudaea sp.]
MAAGAQRYYLGIDDLGRARGPVDALSFHGDSPDSLATQLQAALREPGLFERWRAMQEDPDAVDPGLGATDPAATVTAKQSDLHVDVIVTTRLPHSLLKHRLSLLVGAHWTLRDVKSA